MLACNCGWVGVNLVANHQENTALCPRCKAVFRNSFIYPFFMKPDLLFSIKGYHRDKLPK